MNTMRICEKCGAALPADAPRGLCPRCMMGAALEATVDGRSAESAGGGSAQSSPAAVAPEIGSKLRYFGDYELLDKIAQGGMGVVYKARQVSLNRTVAVKMILGGQLASETEIQRFLTEAEAAANLQHPNIVAIHEVGQHEGRYYFSMDYVEGKNLAEFAERNPLSAGPAAQLVKTIAEAVHYAHQRGTLHRDLKPQNVLMDANGRPHITDFGLARRIEKASDLTQEGSVMGSPSYMPPEQAAGRQAEVGPASDVYSLGAILYQMLTDKAPFSGATAVDTLRQVIEQEPVAPSKLNDKVPSDLETICLKCLEKKPERRYHSARELAEELDRFLNHEPIRARPAGAMRKAWSWSRRNPWALTGLATLVVLAMACCAYGFWQQNRFLQWRAAHPREAVRLGAEPVLITFVWVFFSLFSAVHFVGKAFRRQLQRWQLEGSPIQPWVLRAYGTLGVAMVVYGLVVLFKTLELSVWLGNQHQVSQIILWLMQTSLIVLIWRGVYIAQQAVSLHERTLFGSRADRPVEPPSVGRTRLLSAGWGALFWILAGLFAMTAMMNSIFALLVAVGNRGSISGLGFGPFFWLWALTPIVLMLAKAQALKRFAPQLLISWLLALVGSGIAAWLLHPPQHPKERLMLLIGVFIWNIPAAGLLQLAQRVRAKAYGAPAMGASAASPPQRYPTPNWFYALMLLARQWRLWVWGLFLVAITCFTVSTWRAKTAADRSWREFVEMRQSHGAKNPPPAPPPDELNFAKTPLLEAVAYLDHVNKAAWQPLDKLARNLRLGDFRRGEPNDLHGILEDWTRRGIVSPSLSSNAAEHVLVVLRTIEPELKELRAASRRPYAALAPREWVPRVEDYKNQLNWETLSGLAKVLVIHATASLQLGRAEAALADVEVLSKLARSARRNAWLSALINYWSLHVFWEGQLRHQWTVNQLESISNHLASIDELRQWDEGLPDELADLDRHLGEPLSLALQLSIQPWIFQSQRACNRLFKDFTGNTYDLSRSRVFPDRVRSAVAHARESWAEQNWMVRNYIGDAEGFNKAFRNLTQRQSYINLARAVCALESYHAANGTYPGKLDELEPRFILKVPHDIVTGQPLKYRRTPDNGFLLYSVGWNETDDGGVDSIQKMWKETGGDWVWHCTAKAIR